MPDFTVPSLQPYTQVPATESRSGAAGSDPMLFAMGDHKHPRLTSATLVTLDGSGLATATFTRTFANMPSVDLTAIVPGGTQPVALQVESWVMTGADYSGCVVRGYRGQTTSLAAVTVLGVSVAVGGQTLNAFAAAPGVMVSVIALQNSAV